MNSILTVAICFLSFFALSQKSPRAFGDVSSEELNMKFYDKDPTAPAVVLFDVGFSEFLEKQNEYNYNIIFEKHRRIKVFDKNKFGNTEVKIPLFKLGSARKEEILYIEAHTLNIVNGKVEKSPVSPLSIFEEKINESLSFKKFVFPNVQNGSILEFRYEIETPFKNQMPSWEFQSRIPTIYSKYMVSLVPFYEYVYYLQGIDEFDEMEKMDVESTKGWALSNKAKGQNLKERYGFKDITYKFVLKDVPAFKDESYISSVGNHIIKMYFQLSAYHSPYYGKKEYLSTWPKLNKALLDNTYFGEYISKASRKSRRLIRNLNISDLNSNEKSRAIINYVKSNFEWNGYSSKYASQSPKDLLKSRIGNSADINLFMVGMMQRADIKCEPVILSTREHGLIRDEYPFSFHANYVIGQVGEKSTFLADATDEILPYNRLPPRCLNDKALIVREADETWVSLDFDIPSLEKHVISLTPDPVNASINYTVNIQSNEYEAYSYRLMFENKKSKIEEYFADKIGSINKSKSLFYEDLTRPYIMSFQGKAVATKVGTNLIIKPFFDLPIQKNELIQDKRDYPVELVYRTNNEFEMNLIVPTGYRIVSSPDNFSLNNDLIDISLSINNEEKSLSIVGNYNFKQSIYQAEDYKDIKEYFDIIIEKFNQEIVLEKI